MAVKASVKERKMPESVSASILHTFSSHLCLMLTVCRRKEDLYLSDFVKDLSDILINDGLI